MSEHDWRYVAQVVCKCGYHTNTHDLFSQALGEYMRYVKLSGNYIGEDWTSKSICPICKRKYDDSMCDIWGWNKFATYKQIELLKSKGIKYPETLINDSVQYILNK